MINVSLTQDMKPVVGDIPVIAGNITYELLSFCARRHALTPGEMLVIVGVIRGERASEMAESGQKSVKTVSTQKRSAYRKMGVSTDAEFIHYLYYLRDAVMAGLAC